MNLVTPQMVEEFRATGKRFAPRIPPFPEIVLVDATTRCNLACTHCPNSALTQHDGFLGDMDIGLYHKIVDEVAVHPDTWFRPLNSGEPLLRRDMPAMIRYAKERGIRNVGITTNGTLLTAAMRRQLIEAGLDHLEVSLDAATAETYARVRHACLFDQVINNTLGYIEDAKRAGDARQVIVSFVAQAANHHEIGPFVKFWTGKADAVYIRDYHQHNNLVSPERRLYTHPFQYRHPCPYVFERVVINYEGKIRFCCADWETRHSLGDLRDQSLEEIWQGESYRELRAQHITGTFDHPFCFHCTDWREVHWPGM